MKDDRGIRIAAAIMVRVLYFTGGFVAMSAITCRILGTTHPAMRTTFRGLGVLKHLPGGYVLVWMCVAGLLCALFGPRLYSKAAHRGCGSLQETKQQSTESYSRHKRQ